MIKTAVLMLLVAASTMNHAEAADVTLLSTIAAHSVVDKVQTEFETKTGHRLLVKYDTAGALKREIEAGVQFDAFLLTKDASSALEGSGKLPIGKSRPFATVLLGLAAREGETIPDISTSPKLSAVLMASERISYAKEGASGQSFMKLLAAHAMLEPLHGKLVPMPASRTIEAVASGEVTYGVQLVSEIISVKGAKLVGPLPLEYQSPTQLTIGCSADPCGAETGALIDFLSSTNVANAIEAAGMVVP